MCREILPVSVFGISCRRSPAFMNVRDATVWAPRRSRMRLRTPACKVGRYADGRGVRRAPRDLPPGKSEVATRLDLHCRPLCGKSFGAQCGQHLRPRTEAVRWSSTRVCMIEELTATLTATRSTISPSTKIITYNLPPSRNHGGPSRTLRMDLRICECCCGAPGWRTSRLGVGDPTWLSTDLATSACPSSDLPVVVAGTGLAHQLA
jgi:hypothetical protein